MATNVKIEGSKVILEVNPRFYPQHIILSSVDAFKNIADISLNENTIILTPKEPSLKDIIGYEFFNYMLSLRK